MAEAEEEKNSIFPTTQKSTDHQNIEPFMDFEDLDIGSWPLDQISFFNDINGNNNYQLQPLSPLLISNSDHSYSSLWALADENEDVAQPSSAPLELSCTPYLETEKPMEKDDTMRFPSPHVGQLPLDNPDGYFVFKERMMQALRHFKDMTEQNVLAQIWAPVKDGNRYVLTTSGQPFLIGTLGNGLHQFRAASVLYKFAVSEDGALGLPGRVFRQKFPEWTPNVQYYSCKEYPRRVHAQCFNVQGSLALPVFEPSGQSCVGVVELIMTSSKINYAPEVDKVCKALEAVNLRSSEILDHPNTQIYNEGRQNALAEILEILAVVCEAHKLPLAQTWVPCENRSVLAHGDALKKSCASLDGSCMGQVCMSTTDVAVYVVDPHMCGFREACIEHHLQKGQGVAGRAFLSHNSCFCRNITQFCKTEYPLVHYARMFGLTSCFAICLRSTHTGDDDYILEFFLPPSITDLHQQQILLGSLLEMMKQHFQSLKIASGIELEGEVSVEIIQVSTDGIVDSRLESVRINQSLKSPPGPDGLLIVEDMVQLDSSQQQLMVHLNDINNKGIVASNAGGRLDQFSSLENEDMKKMSERRRRKSEKSISLEVLQQYFSGSLKEAAKSLGVCPTTMKRICRQHGISRWPSRKINKVNRSLSKLQRVIDSVQCAEGTFGLGSLTTSQMPVAVGSHPSSLNRSNKQTSPSFKVSEPQEKNGSSTCKMLDEQAAIDDQSRSPPEHGKSPNSSKTRSRSCEESAGTPNSQGSCQGSPPNESTLAEHPYVSAVNEQYVKVEGSPGSPYQLTAAPNISPTNSIPDAFLMTEPQELFGGILIEDSGSSKDLRNLCPSVADAMVNEQVPEFCSTNPPCPSMASNQPIPFVHKMPHVTARNEMKSVIIKATYGEDIIRFRISLNSGMLELKEEVAKRLKLEVGTFEIKYLDDDHEWILIACDADLQECMDISRSAGSNMIRLLVQDVMPNLGSSWESSGD
ncbi:hypothetical protein ACB092_01G151700 [Castanea dentata]